MPGAERPDQHGFSQAGDAGLVMYVPLMAAAGELRFFTMELFRAHYRIYHVFWVDVAYFAASILFVVILTLQGHFMTGADMCQVTVLAFAASSVVGIILGRDLVPWRPQFSIATLQRIVSFGKFTLGTGVSNEISERADIILIGLFLNPVAVAVYTVAKILWRFFSIFRQVVALLVLPGVSRLFAKKRTADISSVYEKTIAFSYLLLVPFGIAMVVLANPIIAIIYGERYLDSIPVLRVLALYAFFIAPTAIGSMLLTGISRPDAVFKIRWFSTLVNLSLCLACIPLWGPVGAATAVVASTAVSTVLTHREVINSVEFSFRHVLGNILAVPRVARELWSEYRHK
jgi:O-antigen/teichoic acid export membrane protein